MDLIQTVQLETSGADISFAAPLSFDVRIDSGTLLVRDMFDLYRYENILYTIELTGEEIDSYLEYSYDLWTQPDERQRWLYAEL
ncbi:MAG: 5'-nucleotidase C-terminal domain-containing protein [Bacteroidales bacterium]